MNDRTEFTVAKETGTYADTRKQLGWQRSSTNSR